MRIGSTLLLGTLIAFGGDLNPYQTRGSAAACVKKKDNETSKTHPSKIQQELIDNVNLLITKTEKLGVDFPPEDVFKLFGWLYRFDPNKTEDEQVVAIQKDIDKQIASWKSKGLDFEKELTSIKDGLPRFRKNLKDSIDRKNENKILIKAGELIAVPRIFLKATGLFGELAKSEEKEQKTTALNALNFISSVFLRDVEVNEATKSIEELVKSKTDNGHPNSRRIEHYSSKLIEYINAHIETRK